MVDRWCWLRKGRQCRALKIVCDESCKQRKFLQVTITSKFLGVTRWKLVINYYIEAKIPSDESGKYFWIDALKSTFLNFRWQVLGARMILYLVSVIAFFPKFFYLYADPVFFTVQYKNKRRENLIIFLRRCMTKFEARFGFWVDEQTSTKDRKRVWISSDDYSKIDKAFLPKKRRKWEFLVHRRLLLCVINIPFLWNV